MPQNTPLKSSAGQRSVEARRQQRVLIVAALALTGFGLRLGVTSVGSVLGDIQRGLHTGSTALGLLTTLPVLCFAVLGACAPNRDTCHVMPLMPNAAQASPRPH